MEQIKRVSRELIHKGRILDFYEDTMQMPDGNVVKWDFLAHVGAVAVLPILEDGRVVMVRQYRNALERELLELPAGKLDYPHEPGLEVAKRELAEETGYTAKSYELLLSFYTAVAFCNEKIDVYLAKGLEAGEQALDQYEYVSVEIHHLDEVCRMIWAGEIVDMKTVAAIMAYKSSYQGS
ncbi:MAG: NUDIX hydrolase [Lachnospiraceae bacterium]|jgi:ADP-ribose pyrophosphatase|nr:NUDIX hydrolase [Lachnospiraceae bacterium]